MAGPEIVIVGERNLSYRAHAGIEASVALYQREVDAALSFRWISTTALTKGRLESLLRDSIGLWCAPGSPYASTEGALLAIRYAREQQRAFLGTCGGFQHALMEYHRNVLGGEAAHQESEPGAQNPLIAKLSCSMAGVTARVLVSPGSNFAVLAGGNSSLEEFNCNYGLAPAFEPAFAGSAMEFVARDEAGQVRAFRLAGHPFFVGTLFQPERRALSGTLHPLVRAFFTSALSVQR